MLPPVSLRKNAFCGPGIPQKPRNEQEQRGANSRRLIQGVLWLDLVQRLASGRGSAHARKNRPKRPRRKPNASFNHKPRLNARIWWSPTMKKAGPKVLTFTIFDPFGGSPGLSAGEQFLRALQIFC